MSSTVLQSTQVDRGSCPFTDRDAELGVLERAYASRPGLLVLYGRRRVGKTRLLREWLSRHRAKSVYYVAQLTSHEHNLGLMAETAGRQVGDPLLPRVRFSRLNDLLELLVAKGVQVVVIDEITYWLRGGPQVLGELQEFVDHRLESSSMLLVLTGSLVGVMEHEVLGGGSPLYARASWRIKLSELAFHHLRQLLPRLTPVDRVRVYSLVGGLPFYLCLARNPASLEEVVERLIVSEAAPLREEKDLMLREEFREPHSYSAVLSALARGRGTPNEIAQVTGLDPGHVNKALHVMQDLGIVERRVPLFRKRGRYRIRDPILRTWYALVEPVVSLLEAGAKKQALKHVMQSLDEKLVPPVWEDLVRQHLVREWAGEGLLAAGFLEHKGMELDIAVVDKERKRAVVAEVKWRTMGPSEARRFREEAFAKARQMLPGGYDVLEAYVGARGFRGGGKPDWLILPSDLEASMPRVS